MVRGKTQFRVSYSDTDQMGFMHHSNYLKYYENARWELFRTLGIPYCRIEEEGILFPVTEVSVKYFKPAYYDHEISIVTVLKSIKGPRIVFDSVAVNEKGETVNKAQITVASVNKSTGKPCHLPHIIVDRLKELIDDD